MIHLNYGGMRVNIEELLWNYSTLQCLMEIG